MLLPGVMALLAYDSWNDYQALKRIVADAYDQALLEPLTALNQSVSLAVDGSIRVHAPFDVQAMFNEMRPEYKHLHLGLIALPRGNNASDGLGNTPTTVDTEIGLAPGTETTLLGVGDLPPPPTAALQTTPSTRALPLWYDGIYRGYAVRVVALRRTVFDGQGRPYQLLIQAAESTGPREQAAAGSLRQELLRDGRMLAALVLLVWLGVGWSLRPLERLRKSVLLSPPDALAPLDAAHVPHEVRPLVETINHHMACHRAVLTRQAGFLADASHQLRTPLAILLTQAACALREPDPERMRETLRAIMGQLSRSRRLSEQLLALAHASEPQDEVRSFTLVDVNALAREVVLQYLTLAHEKNQDLGWVDASANDAPINTGLAPAKPHSTYETQGSPPDDAAMATPVMADAEEIREVLSNLLHNAVVYTPRGGTITVATRIEGASICVEVCDNGPGIDANQRASAFERFVQLSALPALGVARHGAGLGLAIARGYARRNGGEIELADADSRVGFSRGLRALLRLPRAQLSPAEGTSRN